MDRQVQARKRTRRRALCATGSFGVGTQVVPPKIKAPKCLHPFKNVVVYKDIQLKTTPLEKQADVEKGKPQLENGKRKVENTNAEVPFRKRLRHKQQEPSSYAADKVTKQEVLAKDQQPKILNLH